MILKRNRLPSNAAEQFRADMMRKLGAAPDVIVGGGTIQRFSMTGRRGDLAGWYVYHHDGVPGGAFGDWREGSTYTWCSLAARDMTEAQRLQHQQRVQQAQAQREAARAQAQAAAARAAVALWEKAAPATAEHPYLQAKGVPPFGMRTLASAVARTLAPHLSRELAGPLLVIPMRTATGELRNVQLIDGAGTKRPLTGGEVAGCLAWLGTEPPAASDGTGITVLVCEGFATGVSLHQATGHAVAVAFNAGNLARVATSLRQRWPQARLVLAADDDHRTPGNPGLSKAREAAQAVGAALASPVFDNDRPDWATDFNDLHQLAGLAAVREGIDHAMTTPHPLPEPAHRSSAARQPAPGTSPALYLPDEEEPDWHRNAPSAGEECFYGLVGAVAKAAADGTEVNPAAAGLNMLAFMSCVVGRAGFIRIGNTRHRPMIYTLHVGRSGVGRKGDSLGLVMRLFAALIHIAPNAAPKVYTGGLSSREGLAFQVHDGYSNGKEDVPAVADKRLWVIEPEFANVLHQSKRDGNTLSTALRDCWDGGSIKPATKTNQMHATDPHICLSGAITPTELREMLSGREMTNGFANRFLLAWAERTGLAPFPSAAPQQLVNDLAHRVKDVFELCRIKAAESPTGEFEVTLSPEAAQTYARIYTHLGRRRYGPRIDGLTERAAPMVRRIAMLFALCDLTLEVSEPHVRAAWAWVRYGIESVRYIFESAAEEEATSQVQAHAQRVEEFVRAQPGATRTEVSRDCFGGHLPRQQLDAALEVLLSATPPRLVVRVHKRPAGQPGRPIKRYHLPAPKAPAEHTRAQPGEHFVQTAEMEVI